MGAIVEEYPEEASVRALKAGCTMILMPKDVKATLKAVKSAIKKGEITQKQIDNNVKLSFEEKIKFEEIIKQIEK